MKFRVVFLLLTVTSLVARAGTADPGSANLYERLGVEPSASPKELKSAYYALAKVFHSPHADADVLNTEAFARVAEAYAKLGSSQGRGSYDFDLRHHEAPYTKSATLPKNFAGNAVDQTPAAAPLPKPLIPEIEEFRAASETLQINFTQSANDTVEKIRRWHPEVKAATAKGYYRQVSQAVSTFIAQDVAMQAEMQHLLQKYRAISPLAAELKRAVSAHVQSTRHVFEAAFYHDLYLDDVHEFRRHVERFAPELRAAGADLNSLGVGELKTYVDSFFRSNHYGYTALFELAQARHLDTSDERTLRYGLAALATEQSFAPIKDRWLVGIGMMLTSMAQIEDSPEKAWALERYLHWLDAGVQEYLPESHTPRNDRIQPLEWSSAMNSALDHLQALADRFPKISARAVELKTTIEEKAKSAEIKVVFAAVKPNLKSRLMAGCDVLINRLGDLRKVF